MARQLIEPMDHQEPPLRMTYEEFLAWADEDTHAEWVDGEVFVFMPPVKIHQLLIGFLYNLLWNYADLLDLGTVMLSPFAMRIRDGRSHREPDVIFVADEREDRFNELRLEGGADLVVEIVSDDSVTRDRRDKFAEYAAVGIPEYWLLDPRLGRRRAQFFQLDGEGVYNEHDLDTEGRYHSAVLPGLWVNPDWFWQMPLPSPNRLLALIAPDLWRDPRITGQEPRPT